VVSRLVFVPVTAQILTPIHFNLYERFSAGYTSTAANDLRDKLLQDREGKGWVVHSRVLGNVLYLMASMTSSKESLKIIEAEVLEALRAG
jgi:bifunctional dethiobiotin synthetase / adenosylmethionine---8-amino-7-oxononanoate aminotransferase